MTVTGASSLANLAGQSDMLAARKSGREGANKVMEYKDRLEFALAATGTGLWTYDGVGKKLEWDERAKALWGFGAEGAITEEAFLSSIHPEDVVAIRDLFTDSADPGPQTVDLEFRIRRFDSGAERWIACRCKRMGSGNSAEIVATARDITAARLHDQQVHILMREVTHRSKNLLAIIQAMARQTVKDSLTAADFETRFSSRLRGLSFSHEILASHDWRGAYIGDLARGHLGHVLEQHGDRIDIAGPVLFIKPEAAQNIGLALNELTSNALKFGALSGRNGRISIEWSIEGEQSRASWLHLVWNEYGGPGIQPPLRQGFGHKVMERVVARALDGIVNMTYAPTGLQWSLRVPASHIVVGTAPAAV